MHEGVCVFVARQDDDVRPHDLSLFKLVDDPLAKLVSVHARHKEIEKNDIDGAVLFRLAEQDLTLLAIGGVHDLMLLVH